MNARAILLLLAGLCVGQLPGVSRGQPPKTVSDPRCDVILRPTDPGGAAPYDPIAHHAPDVLQVTLGNWTPVDPQADLFAGDFAPVGVFLRLDIEFEGLVNPPGPTTSSFDPFRHGPHPVFGFVEVDIDRDHHTGGETAAPQFRFLSNVARFGGLPSGDRFEDRVLRTPEDDDSDFASSPYIERSGEEFHLALLPSAFEVHDISRVSADPDDVFEAGETWIIDGQWFHRAHGFEPFSFASGGGVSGEYMPTCRLRFSHSLATDTTTVSLVFPLTNAAAALAAGESTQPHNADPSDHASVDEGLNDLTDSARFLQMFPSGLPEEILIQHWADRASSDLLAARLWRVTLLAGSSYTVPGFDFVWTDVFPNPIRGDLNGEHGVDHDDYNDLDDYLHDHDDEDGVVDGQVAIALHPQRFSVFDVNGDGIVGPTEYRFLSQPGDIELDDDVDVRDFARLQQCFGESAANPCDLCDLNFDAETSSADACRFFQWMFGPQ